MTDGPDADFGLEMRPLLALKHGLLSAQLALQGRPRGTGRDGATG